MCIHGWTGETKKLLIKGVPILSAQGFEKGAPAATDHFVLKMRTPKMTVLIGNIWENDD